MQIPRSLFAALAALTFTLGAVAADSATGILGRARLGFTADRYRLSGAGVFDSTGRGYTIEVGIPIVRWLDLGVEHFRVGVDGPASLKLERHATLLSAVWHGVEWGAARPFVAAGYGTYAQEASGKQKDQAWQVSLGAEIPLARRLTFTPIVTRFQARDLDHEEWRAEIVLGWEVFDHVTLTARARHGDIAGQTRYQRYAVGATFLY